MFEYHSQVVEYRRYGFAGSSDTGAVPTQINEEEIKARLFMFIVPGKKRKRHATDLASKTHFVKPLDLLSLTLWVPQLFQKWLSPFTRVSSFAKVVSFHPSLTGAAILKSTQRIFLPKEIRQNGHGEVINTRPLCIHLPSLLYCPPSVSLSLSGSA